MGSEIKIGSIVMLADPSEAPHVLVVLRGDGAPGQRPLLGQVTMTREEWEDLAIYAVDHGEHADAIRVACAVVNQFFNDPPQNETKDESIARAWSALRLISDALPKPF